MKLAVVEAGIHSGASDFFLADAVICWLVWGGRP